jgi:iron complex outermembrane receptor protein
MTKRSNLFKILQRTKSKRDIRHYEYYWRLSQDLSNFNNSEQKRLEADTDIYQPKIITDLQINYQVNTKIKNQLGVNNLLNICPKEQNSFTDSVDLWDATQMGMNGSFYYIKLNIKL